MRCMDMLYRTIIDIATGETTVVPFTEQETAAHLAKQQKIADEEAALIADEKAKAEAKQLLLEKLGITQDEAKLLLS